MKPVRTLLSAAVVAALAITPVALTGGTATQAAASTRASASTHMHINCAQAGGLCTEVRDSDSVFGHYVGHDEPSMAWYSNRPGVGQPHALHRDAADRPIGEPPQRGEQVVRVRAQRR